MKKLIEREHLQHIASELFYIKIQSPTKLQDRLEELIKYFEENILQQDKDTKNEFKRVIYTRMKTAKTKEENECWYKFYKNLDDTFS